MCVDCGLAGRPTGRAGGGRGEDDVTTHLLVALYKARRGGGRKRRSNRYYYQFVEQGGGPCCPLKCCPPPLSLPHAQRQNEVPACRRRPRKRHPPSNRIPGWTSRLGKAMPNGRHSAPPTATQGDMLQHPPVCTHADTQLRPKRAAQNASGV